MGNLQALALQEIVHHGFTHGAIIASGGAITESGAGVAQKIDLGALAPGATIKLAQVSLKKPFEDNSDETFNTTTLTVKIVDKDGADKEVLFTGLELNEKGTEITEPQVYDTPTAPAVAGDKLVGELTPLAGKSLTELDTGEVAVYFEFGSTGNPGAGTQVQGAAVPKHSEPADYEGKTVAELKDLAAEKGIAVPWDARKDEIIKELKKADKAKAS